MYQVSSHHALNFAAPGRGLGTVPGLRVTQSYVGSPREMALVPGVYLTVSVIIEIIEIIETMTAQRWLRKFSSCSGWSCLRCYNRYLLLG